MEQPLEVLCRHRNYEIKQKAQHCVCLGHAHGGVGGGVGVLHNQQNIFLYLATKN